MSDSQIIFPPFHFFIMKKLILVFSLLTLGFWSCKKSEEVVSTQTEQEVLKESEEAEANYSDAISTAEDALNGSIDRVGGRVEGCATVKVDLEKQEATIDFGEGCKGKDGKTRKGKITVRFKGKNKKDASERTISFVNFSVNGYTITGTVQQYGFKLLNGKIQYSQAIKNGVIKFEDGKTLVISTERTVEWSEGMNTPLDPRDDVYRITGNSTGVNKAARNFTSTITEPLVFKVSCFLENNFYPVSGKAEMTVDGKKATIDYGTGTCDKKATMTLSGQVIQINLP